MSTPGDVLNEVVPTLIRLARGPGALLLTAASLAVGSFAILALVLALEPGTWIPFVIASLLALPVGVLAVRRRRLHRQTESLTAHQTLTAGPSEAGAAPSERAFTDAVYESSLRTARVFPRVEAAQRAALAAAGGPVRAPYLKDDLRVTLLALLGTLAAVPLATLGAIITAIALLS